MKKKSPPYAIIGAVVLGIVAIGLFVHWKNGEDARVQKELDDQKAALQAEIDAANSKPVPVAPTMPNMRNVFYATEPVEAGAKMSAAFFEKKPTPVDILPDAYAEGSDIIGFYAIRKIEKGDPLTPRNIGKSLPFMTQRIALGMRTVSLPVFNAEANFTGGFAVDGDKVDLLYTSMQGDVRISTQLVMQNVSIFYIPGPQIKSADSDGLTPAPPPGEPISVTFEVTPEQAQALVYLSGAKNGQFSMILRARRDKSEIKIPAFAGADYLENLKKIQKMTDKSNQRVQDLAQKIEAEEKTEGSQGNTNETTTPTPPSP